jgi:hypothetical protein
MLDRLVGIARKTSIHLSELRQLGNVSFIYHSGVLRLDLDHLTERLNTEELFKGTSAVLKRSFRVVGDLSGNGLKSPYSPHQTSERWHRSRLCPLVETLHHILLRI